jgi:hypothetical protein
MKSETSNYFLEKTLGFSLPERQKIGILASPCLTPWVKDTAVPVLN